MKTRIAIILAALTLAASSQQKVSERPSLSSGDLAPATDILPIVDVSAGTAGSKKITIDNLFTGWGVTTPGALLMKASDTDAQWTALGLGTAAALAHGTAAGNLVRLDPATGKLPAVDGSMLTNLPSGGGGGSLPPGGEPGQVLAKASEDDGDAEWTDLESDPGSWLTTASSQIGQESWRSGTGKLVGVTSGTLQYPTITSPILGIGGGADATGDLYYRSASGGYLTRLGIGTTGQVLTVASGLPSWATPSGGGDYPWSTNSALVSSLSFEEDLEDRCRKRDWYSGDAFSTTAQAKTGSRSLATSSSMIRQGPPSMDWAFGTGDFTVELWARIDAIDAAYYRAPIGNWAAGNGGWCIFFKNTSTPGALAFYGPSTPLATGNGVVAAATWEHIAVTRASGTLRIFANGTVQATAAGDTTNFTSVISPVLGGNMAGSSDRFPGYIDDVRIFKGYAAYTANFTPPASPHSD